jgi:hypothetical protein
MARVRAAQAYGWFLVWPAKSCFTADDEIKGKAREYGHKVPVKPLT